MQLTREPHTAFSDLPRPYCMRRVTLKASKCNALTHCSQKRQKLRTFKPQALIRPKPGRPSVKRCDTRNMLLTS